MRRFLIPLLMASVLTPAAAYAQREDRDDRSEKSDNQSNDRPQRVQRVERSDSDAPRVRIERADRPARVERSVELQSSEPARVRRSERNLEARSDEPVRVRRFDRNQAVQPAQQVRRIERRRDGRNESLAEAFQEAGREEATVQNGGVVVRHDGDRDGDRRWDGRRDGDRRWDGNRDRNHRWSRDWRRDGRYNWYNYRHRYGSLFRLGRYYDPYRYGYRRFSIGFSLWPSYYGSNYWLNDPWRYRLPPAYGPYRWVRYYDDALLVNIYTGEVVDVIYSFFW